MSHRDRFSTDSVITRRGNNTISVTASSDISTIAENCISAIPILFFAVQSYEIYVKMARML
jgi:hypothetical protein